MIYSGVYKNSWWCVLFMKPLFWNDQWLCMCECVFCFVTENCNLGGVLELFLFYHYCAAQIKRVMWVEQFRSVHIVTFSFYWITYTFSCFLGMIAVGIIFCIPALHSNSLNDRNRFHVDIITITRVQKFYSVKEFKFI